MSCLRCVRRAKADAPCGAYSRGDVLTTKKDLTRRANHWHLFIIARSLRARAGKPVAGFFNRKDERLAKSPVLGNTCPSAAARARLCSWFRSCKKILKLPVQVMVMCTMPGKSIGGRKCAAPMGRGFRSGGYW